MGKGESYGLVIYEGAVWRDGGPDNDACTSWRLLRGDQEIFVSRDDLVFVKAPWDRTAEQLAAVVGRADGLMDELRKGYRHLAFLASVVKSGERLSDDEWVEINAWFDRHRSACAARTESR